MTEVRLPIDARSVAAARDILQQTLHQYGVQTHRVTPTDTVESAVLMLSELVTNAVRHTSGLLLLEITICSGSLHVAVADDAPEVLTLTDEDCHATSGRGLKIVAALANRWGCTPGAGRKTVWFEITLP